MANERIYTTRRLGILKALCEVLKKIDGTGEYLSNLNGRVEPRLLFWDEVEEFPSVHLSSGQEFRQYQSGGYKDRFLGVSVRVYVQEEDAVAALDRLMEDIETVLEENSRLTYYDKRGIAQCTHQLSITSIETDEGALEPIGSGTISILVQY